MISHSDYNDALDSYEQASIEETQKQVSERDDVCRQSLAQVSISTHTDSSESLFAHISTLSTRDMIHCSLIKSNNCVCKMKISERKRLRISIDEGQNFDFQTQLSLTDFSIKRRRYIDSSQAQTFNGKKFEKSKNNESHCIISSDAEKKRSSLLSLQKKLSTNFQSKKSMTK